MTGIVNKVTGSAKKTKMQSTRSNLGLASSLVVMALCAVGCTSSVESPPKVDIGNVSLVIDFPDDSQQADLDLQIGCAADSTVFEVLQRAEKVGGLKVEHSSNVIQESASIFLNGFNGVANAEGKFWTYYVNDELAKEGCGTYVVKPDDKIRWVYGQPPAELE